MTPDPNAAALALRVQAEELAAARSPAHRLTNAQMQAQLHELQVSQIELEMQSAALAKMEHLKDAFETGFQHYEQLYDLAPVSYFSIARSGHIARANVAAATLLKIQQGHLLGKKFEQFVAPEGQMGWRRFIDAVFASGVRQVLEVSLFVAGAAQGVVRIEANVDLEQDTFRMMVNDLGAPEVRESALRRAFVVLDNINEAVLVTDARRCIVSVNPSFTAMTGYQAEEAIGREPHFLRSTVHAAPFFDEIWQTVSRKGSWQGELWQRKKNGEAFVASMSITQMRLSDGSVSNFVGVFSDITARKRAENALRSLHRELDQRVVKRTAELTQSNHWLHQEIAERERAQGALRSVEHFYHATLDSLSDCVLVLDENGTMIYANKAFSAFADVPAAGTGYFDFCEKDPRWRDGAGLKLAAGIRAVIDGALDTFALEFNFSTEQRAAWFQCTVNRFLGESPVRVVVAHNDITERKMMERAVRDSHAQLRQLALHLETAKEDERKRIARDIHDELGQNLLALRIDISMLSARTEAAHPRLHKKVGATLHNVDATIKSVRSIINELRPPVLDLGPQAALEWQISEFKKRSNLACHLQIEHDALPCNIGSAIEVALFRIVQEALSNVQRHASAQQVQIVLSTQAGFLCLSISDDGVGIGRAQRDKQQCFGLIGIAERVSALGGQFALTDYCAGQGCHLNVRIPLPEQKVE